MTRDSTVHDTTTRTEPGTAPSPSAPLGGRAPAWLLVAAAMFAIAWGGNEFTPLLVSYKSDGMDPVIVDFLLFAYVVGIVPALAISAPLSDRIGRRPVALPAPWIGIAGSLLLALGGDLPALLALGRVLSGVALGIAMAVGGSWLKEVSSAPFDPNADGMAGPRRQGLALTSGFALGAAVAGLLAQWAPLPHVLPYVIHIALSVPAGLALLRVPETVSARSSVPHHPARDGGGAEPAPDAAPSRSLWSVVSSPRFFFLVVLVAPWVFGAAGVAYAIVPAQLASSVSAAPVAFSALLCVLTLGSGFLVQQFARHLTVPGTIRLGTLAYVLIVAGMVLAAVTVSVLDRPALAIGLGIVTSIVLGLAYGMALQTGLLEVQQVAGHHDLAAYTAVFYALAYLGFGFPMVLSALAESFTYTEMLAAGIGVAFVSGVAMLTAASRRK